MGSNTYLSKTTVHQLVISGIASHSHSVATTRPKTPFVFLIVTTHLLYFLSGFSLVLSSFQHSLLILSILPSLSSAWFFMATRIITASTSVFYLGSVLSLPFLPHQNMSALDVPLKGVLWVDLICCPYKDFDLLAEHSPLPQKNKSLMGKYLVLGLSWWGIYLKNMRSPARCGEKIKLWSSSPNLG